MSTDTFNFLLHLLDSHQSLLLLGRVTLPGQRSVFIPHHSYTRPQQSKESVHQIEQVLSPQPKVNTCGRPQAPQLLLFNYRESKKQ